MNSKCNDLGNDIEMLIDVVSQTTKIPDYNDIKVVVNDSNMVSKDGRIVLNKTCYLSIEDYSKEYHANKNQGLGWINLQCAGIMDGVLIVVIEYPKKTDDKNNSYTSVNLSGPFYNQVTGFPEWNFSKKFVLN